MKASVRLSSARTESSGPACPADNHLINDPSRTFTTGTDNALNPRIVRMPKRAFHPALLVNRLIVRSELKSGEIISSPNPNSMWRLERVWEERNRTSVLLAGAAIILIIAVADWWTKPFVAFGVLYLFPIMLAAGFLPRWVIGLAGRRLRSAQRTFQFTGPVNRSFRF